MPRCGNIACMTERVAAANHEMSWFMSGVGVYFFASGIFTVLFPWLLAIELQEPADRIGIAQMLAMLPLLTLTLFGGAKADRSELRGHLIRWQLATGATHVALCAAIMAGFFFYELLIVYVLVLSAISAFVMPARDALLTHVVQRTAGATIQQAVAGATGVQFLSQVAGLLAGGAAALTGAPALLAVQAAFLAASALTTVRLKPTEEPAPLAASHSRLGEIREGIEIVWQSERMRPVVLLMFFSGILFIGVFMVLFPILIRDVYSGDSFQIALVNVCFFGGIGSSSIIQARVRPIRRQGRAIMIAMVTGSTVMMFLHFGLPIWAVYLLALCWGLASGVSMTQSRAVVQAAASDTHRARVLSVFQLGTMGGGPVGALATGYAIEWLGPLDAVLVPAGCMVVVWLGIFTFTGLWRVEAPTQAPAPAAD